MESLHCFCYNMLITIIFFKVFSIKVKDFFYFLLYFCKFMGREKFSCESIEEEFLDWINNVHNCTQAKPHQFVLFICNVTIWKIHILETLTIYISLLYKGIKVCLQLQLLSTHCLGKTTLFFFPYYPCWGKFCLRIFNSIFGREYKMHHWPEGICYSTNRSWKSDTIFQKKKCKKCRLFNYVHCYYHHIVTAVRTRVWR